MFKQWPIVLIILTYNLVIFGTFLTRSGLLVFGALVCPEHNRADLPGIYCPDHHCVFLAAELSLGEFQIPPGTDLVLF